MLNTAYVAAPCSDPTWFPQQVMPLRVSFGGMQTNELAHLLLAGRITSSPGGGHRAQRPLSSMDADQKRAQGAISAEVCVHNWNAWHNIHGVLALQDVCGFRGP